MQQGTPENLIFQKVNSYAKIYPDFTRLIKFSTPIDVRESGWEAREEEFSFMRERNSGQEAEAILDSIRRTKTRLQDIVLCNQFDLFCTFTFAKNREDIIACKTRMSNWLDNQRRRKGKFSYAIVPEFHKDGKSLHFHALFKNYKGELTNSGIKQKGKEIFNIPSYKNGYTTASYIQNQEKTASYVRKYITKDMPLFPGKKRYWVSNDLVRPEKIVNPYIPLNEFADYQKLHQSDGLTYYINEHNNTNTINN
jgi:hypothetical protein